MGDRSHTCQCARTVPGVSTSWIFKAVQFGKLLTAATVRELQPGPPDGKSIVYGEVECESTHSCAIHRIDLATGKVGTLPDSDGLMTARWSPDGRFIAALNPEQSQVMLFDVKSEKWRKLADAITGPDLSWSADSNYLYANAPGNDARIVRIRISDGSRKTMFEFHSQDKFDLADSEDTAIRRGARQLYNFASPSPI